MCGAFRWVGVFLFLLLGSSLAWATSGGSSRECRDMARAYWGFVVDLDQEALILAARLASRLREHQPSNTALHRTRITELRRHVRRLQRMTPDERARRFAEARLAEPTLLASRIVRELSRELEQHHRNRLEPELSRFAGWETRFRDDLTAFGARARKIHCFDTAAVLRQ